MKFLKKYSSTLLTVALFIGGIASAAISPSFPSSLPNAVPGAIIKASDINTLTTSVQNLDKRSFQDAGNNDITFLSSTGSARTSGNGFIIGFGGGLGIGTLSPLNHLDAVASTTRADILVKSNGTASENGNTSFRWKNDVQQYGLNVNGWQGDELALWNETTNSDIITFDTNGNVGMGTSNPGAKLEVNGNTKIHGTIKSGGANAIQTTIATIQNVFPAGVCDRPWNTFGCHSAADVICRDQNGYSGGYVTQWDEGSGNAKIVCAP